ncbi:hypothetical protein BpHYR1_037120 [Brachionus plicatilis]|uniref:Uncharacterized protein n=1 Tax=Brachionus plicatilis TaxID=10195 RepID=A0A3M7SY87_BRAPC|nr:hypothetical protein BpHYR1_037120 [Brachionus plicatilis]
MFALKKIPVKSLSAFVDLKGSFFNIPKMLVVCIQFKKKELKKPVAFLATVFIRFNIEYLKERLPSLLNLIRNKFLIFQIKKIFDQIWNCSILNASCYIINSNSFGHEILLTKNRSHRKIFINFKLIISSRYSNRLEMAHNELLLKEFKT